jgi:hypothetical protein
MVSVEEKGPVGEKRGREGEDKKNVGRKRRRKEKKIKERNKSGTRAG